MTISIQKILKFLIIIFWLSVNIIIIFSDENIFINYETILYINILFLSYYLLSWSNHVVTIIYTLIGIMFVLQRILVICFDANNIAGKETNYILSAADIVYGIIFVILLNLSIIIFSLVSVNIRTYDRSQINNGDFFFKILRYYPYIYIIFWSIRISYMLKTGIGLSVNPGDFEHGLTTRLINFCLSANFLLYIGIFLCKKNNKIFILGLFLLLLNTILEASKAALIGIVFQLLIAYLLTTSYKIKIKYIFLFGFIVFLSSVTLTPALMIFRSSALEILGNISLMKIITLFFESLYSVNYLILIKKSLLDISERMALLEWLALFVHIGRDSFTSNINMYHLLVDCINSLVPGDLIETNFLPVAKFITLIWKGWTTELHGELPGGFGSLYLYFGFIGGVLVFNFIYFLICYFMNKCNIVISIILVGMFIDFMIGGLLEAIFQYFIENIVLIIIFSIFIKIFDQFKRNKYLKVRHVFSS